MNKYFLSLMSILILFQSFKVADEIFNHKKDQKKVAREMIIMTMNANKTMKTLNFHEISCWVCHRGSNHPLHPPSKK